MLDAAVRTRIVNTSSGHLLKEEEEAVATRAGTLSAAPVAFKLLLFIVLMISGRDRCLVRMNSARMSS